MQTRPRSSSSSNKKGNDQIEHRASAVSEQSAKKAAEIMAAGGVVGIPTETVYGLAADARNEAAVRSIFEAKGRPQDNPLIVHISALEQLPPLVREIPELALKIAEKYWPGPLTMIFRSRT